MSRRFVAGLIAVLAAGSAQAGQGTTVWESGGASLRLWGGVREIFGYSKGTDAEGFEGVIAATVAQNDTICVDARRFANCPAFDLVNEKNSFQGFTRLRIGGELRANDMFSATLVYDHELLYGTLDTLETGLRDTFRERDTFMGAEGVIMDRQHFEWTHRLYRAYASFESERVEIDIGRQRVAWGVARLWNPMDRFSAIGPLAIEGDQIPGIDAIDARWLFDGFSFLELVYAPGTNSDRARYAARLHGVLWDTDLSLMGGVFQRAPTVGFDFARNLGGAAIRLEAVYTDPDLPVWKIDEPEPAPLDDFWQVVLSIDGSLDLGSGLSLLLEYLYNGNALGFGRGKAGPLLPLFESGPAGDSPLPLPEPPPARSVRPGSVDLFGTSRVVTRSRHLTGFQLGYDVLPELRGQMLVIYDWEGTSAAFFPTLVYTPLDFMEVTLGFQGFVGPKRSEYGNLANQVYLLVDFFF